MRNKFTTNKLYIDQFVCIDCDSFTQPHANRATIKNGIRTSLPQFRWWESPSRQTTVIIIKYFNIDLLLGRRAKVSFDRKLICLLINEKWRKSEAHNSDSVSWCKTGRSRFHDLLFICIRVCVSCTRQLRLALRFRLPRILVCALAAAASTLNIDHEVRST